ncbi:hypothetical protein C7B65_03740 [Phormidesmis priestleyi ULC007]|uniref:Uncharacterized protein n=1 Tax=Phormidesmis priestleyi ULC007 TaxID=1920490 RepID=A0A2T1DMH6_9CYAN|nr:hypothetical protein [Phormidesmis priestleyi]PSB21700.1 hypothetical protein C7B65_03740 [Phormidesmis priestleyi ULC007]PZO50823.1 MAG: hypothetical protein DCF14_10550 [Phormidesmis priestleyi]
MQTKKLELLLLAGCSCLFTMLCQPIAQAVTASPTETVLQISAQLEGLYCRTNFQENYRAKANK